MNPVVILLISTLFLVMDSVYCLVYFKFSYLLELKRRYFIQAKIPAEYKDELRRQVHKEYTQSRALIYTGSLIVWASTTAMFNLWFAVIVLLGFDLIIDFFSSQSYYFSPYAYLLRNLVNLAVYISSLVYVLSTL